MELKLKIGITGQSGFVGSHLYNTLGLFPDNYERISFDDDYFDAKIKLQEFVQSCDVIIHLAAINRSQDQHMLYEMNLRLVNQLIDACEQTKSSPHILFSSSIQENRQNDYGRSKKEGREKFEQWARKNKSNFTGLVIPNVFGPFGRPHYNSVVATFCHQLSHGEIPHIETDGELELIYVGQLISEVLTIINKKSLSKDQPSQEFVNIVEPTHRISVSSLLAKLSSFRETYTLHGEIPNLNSQFDLNLFNTYFSYHDHEQIFPFHLNGHTDNRGSFVETIRLNSGGQISFSTTEPGITRGNHYHTRKAERFAVISGKAKIELRRIGTEKKLTFYLDGEAPSFVDMPIWYTHNISNIGDNKLFTIFWINEHFNESDPDTYYEPV
jgi:UDP-2-acetamido-2,6-beta-L-arabino-hexul-4-ose reductase